MGTDIHLHIEINIDGEWHHWANPHVKQNYTLFGKMAGVRGGGAEPIAKPRGIPWNITVPTKLDYDRMEVDAHTASWLNKDEIDELREWLREEYAGFQIRFDLEHGILHTYLFGEGITTMANGVDDVRFVFWFDC